MKVRGEEHVTFSLSLASKTALNKVHDVNTGECVINTLNGEVRHK